MVLLLNKQDFRLKTFTPKMRNLLLYQICDKEAKITKYHQIYTKSVNIFKINYFFTKTPSKYYCPAFFKALPPKKLRNCDSELNIPQNAVC